MQCTLRPLVHSMTLWFCCLVHDFVAEVFTVRILCWLKMVVDAKFPRRFYFVWRLCTIFLVTSRDIGSMWRKSHDPLKSFLFILSKRIKMLFDDVASLWTSIDMCLYMPESWVVGCQAPSVIPRVYLLPLSKQMAPISYITSPLYFVAMVTQFPVCPLFLRLSRNASIGSPRWFATNNSDYNKLGSWDTWCYFVLTDEYLPTFRWSMPPCYLHIAWDLWVYQYHPDTCLQPSSQNVRSKSNQDTQLNIKQNLQDVNPWSLCYVSFTASRHDNTIHRHFKTIISPF